MGQGSYLDNASIMQQHGMIEQDDNEMVGLFLKYFVLSPTKNTPYGAASRKALLAYAEAIDGENPKLAFELQSWARHAEAKATADK